MATARRQGSNVTVDTFDDTGMPDYTDVSTWEADTDLDLVTNTISYRLELQQSKVYSITGPTLAGATTSSDYRRSIGPDASVIHDGTPNTGAGFSSTSLRAISVSEDFTQIHDLIIQHSANASSNSDGINLDGDETGVIGCIIDSPSNDGSGSARGIRFSPDAGESSFAVDCLIFDSDNVGMVNTSSGVGFAYNCTSINAGSDNFKGFGGGITCINCIGQGGGSNDYASGTTPTTSISSDTTGNIQATLTFVNAASNDYHLVSGDSDAIDAGTDLSADSDYAFDDDIDGDTFAAGHWSIGFDFFVHAHNKLTTGAHFKIGSVLVR